MFFALAIVGIVALASALYANSSNLQFAESGSAPPSWLRRRRLSRLVALPLALGSLFVWYPYEHGDEQYRVIGFPFFAAALDAAGRDYVGPLTLPAMAGNGVLFYLLPQLWLFAIRRRGP